MITAYKHALHHPSQIIETEINHSASWINVVEPDREEIEGLMEFYNIPEDFIRDPLDSEESARIEYDGYSLLLILTYRQFYQSTFVFVTIPLGIIIGNGIVMTVCDAENEF